MKPLHTLKRQRIIQKLFIAIQFHPYRRNVTHKSIFSEMTRRAGSLVGIIDYKAAPHKSSKNHHGTNALTTAIMATLNP